MYSGGSGNGRLEKVAGQTLATSVWRRVKCWGEAVVVARHVIVERREAATGARARARRSSRLQTAPGMVQRRLALKAPPTVSNARVGAAAAVRPVAAEQRVADTGGGVWLYEKAPGARGVSRPGGGLGAVD